MSSTLEVSFLKYWQCESKIVLLSVQERPSLGYLVCRVFGFKGSEYSHYLEPTWAHKWRFLTQQDIRCYHQPRSTVTIAIKKVESCGPGFQWQLRSRCSLMHPNSHQSRHSQAVRLSSVMFLDQSYIKGGAGPETVSWSYNCRCFPCFNQRDWSACKNCFKNPEYMKR